MADQAIRGRFVWHELMSSDPDGAAAFFARAIGWSTQPFEHSPGYRMFLAGGQVLRAPEDIPFVGRFAMLADPQGAMFAAFTPESSAGGDAPGARTFSWHELATTDPQGAVPFYRRLFGWQETGSADMGPEMGLYRMFGFDGAPRGGIYAKPREMAGPAAWLAYIRVPDAARSAQAIAAAGGTVINGTMEVPGGDWIAVALDPEGVPMAVHAVSTAPPKPAAAKKKATARNKATVRKKATLRKKAIVKRKAAAKQNTAAKTTATKKKASPRKKVAARKKVATRKKVVRKGRRR